MVTISVSDPLHFNADPDPANDTDPTESGSGSETLVTSLILLCGTVFGNVNLWVLV